MQGDRARLTLYVSRLPQDGEWLPGRPVADLRLVTYWLAHNGSRPLGLARFEAPQVTADPSLTLPPPDGSDDGSHVIAEEVRSLSFRYFDGTSWYDSWDGTEPGDDYFTPVGPPLAIEIVLALAAPREDGRPDRPQDWKYYRHVVAIPAANGLLR